jgi:SWI/SNF-related matrix-associated actin-dependent regulator 1 of chromatin subfamily A
MTITETERDYEISFPFDPVKLRAVKEIPGARYYGSNKTWHVPLHRQKDINFLRQKFNVGEFAPVQKPEEIGEIPPLPELKTELPLIRKPFPFQSSGIAYGLEKKRLIIGDQPGLGKTIQAIGIVSGANAFPCLVICPSTLKLNWQKEWKDCTGKRALILSDKVKTTFPKYHEVGMVDIFICNYESLEKYFVQDGWKKPEGKQFKLNDIPFKPVISLFKSVIIDESHKCKDGSTQQSKFVMGICKQKQYALCLTGTPVVNKPKDLISQLVIINRLSDIVSHCVDYSGKDRSGYRRFILRYCDGGRGESNLRELNYRLNLNCFYRREKSEVLKDLPAKMRQVILCEISNRSEYDKAENEFVHYLKTVRGCSDEQVKKKLRGEIMVKMGILKQISARGKIAEVKDYVNDIIDSGEKIILFCYLKEIIHELKRIYPHALTIYGEDSLEARNNSVKSFQTNPASNIIICNYKSGGVGLTLTASSRVAFVEFPWTFADCEQCEDRAHRIGQVDSVQCAYFLGENTIDRYCYELIQKKKTIAQTITGAVDDVAEEIIDQLLTLFNQK